MILDRYHFDIQSGRSKKQGIFWQNGHFLVDFTPFFRVSRKIFYKST